MEKQSLERSSKEAEYRHYARQLTDNLAITEAAKFGRIEGAEENQSLVLHNTKKMDSIPIQDADIVILLAKKLAQNNLKITTAQELTDHVHKLGIGWEG